ncbi:damage-inducible protein DinB, partial [Xylella fastidiosa subsp. multiplex]|nr:damage-inducible protein DinB [Xylella fastidiosa subsp. multiplex]
MSARTLLTSMFRYKAWADESLFAGLLAARGTLPEDDLEAA